VELFSKSTYRSQAVEHESAQSRVFVIDDDAAIRDAVDSLRRSVGLQVELFASADEFFQCQHHWVADT
jgi:FixJ family two-component response regulator